MNILQFLLRGSGAVSEGIHLKILDLRFQSGAMMSSFPGY